MKCRRFLHSALSLVMLLVAATTAVAKSDNGTCLSCFVRVRPQVFQEVKIAGAVHNCDSCRRFLYYELALKPATDQPSVDAAAEVPATDVQAADGQSL